jgi:hypothetical protein
MQLSNREVGCLLPQPGGFEGFGAIEVVRRSNRTAIPQLRDHALAPFDGDAASLAGPTQAIDDDYSVIARVDQLFELNRKVLVSWIEQARNLPGEKM